LPAAGMVRISGVRLILGRIGEHGDVQDGMPDAGSFVVG